MDNLCPVKGCFVSFLRISNPKTGEVIHDSRKGDHLAMAYIGGLLIEHYSQPRTFADPNWTDADEKEWQHERKIGRYQWDEQCADVAELQAIDEDDNEDDPDEEDE